MTHSAAPDVSVIIVNYGTADLALEAIASVLALEAAVRDIHIVDNASPGDDAVRLSQAIAARGWHGRVTLHAETVNHGFGRGNNLVIEALARQPAPPGKVFLLNPDARLENAAVTILSEFLDAHPQVGAAGARIEKPGPDGIPGPVTAAFRFPSLISIFEDAAAFGPVSRLCANRRVPLPPDLPTGPVDWVSGAAVMLRTEALRQVGAFDPEFFLYYEEVDLMRQLSATGWQTWYVAEALVIHAEGAATGVKSGQAERRRLPPYWYHSWQYYLRKNHGRAVALAGAAAWVLGAAMNHAITRIRGRAPATPAHFFSDFWAVGIRPLIGLKAKSYE